MRQSHGLGKQLLNHRMPMTEIVALLDCLAPYLAPTNIRQLRRLIFALLCIPGRVTTLGLSRWAERGGSYRTLQRWYQTPLDWRTLLWIIARENFARRSRREAIGHRFCDAFLINDLGIKRVKEIRVLILDELDLDPPETT